MTRNEENSLITKIIHEYSCAVAILLVSVLSTIPPPWCTHLNKKLSISNNFKQDEQKKTENVPHPVSFHCFLLYCVGITKQIAILCFFYVLFFCMFVNQREINVFANTKILFTLVSFFCKFTREWILVFRG